MPSTDTDRSRLALLAERRPVALFFALATATSWTVWIPTLLVLPDGNVRLLAIVPGAFGPLVAAGTVTTLRGESVRRWVVDALAWRRSVRWYAVAVAVPLSVSVVLLGTLVALTGSFRPWGVPEWLRYSDSIWSLPPFWAGARRSSAGGALRSHISRPATMH